MMKKVLWLFISVCLLFLSSQGYARGALNDTGVDFCIGTSSVGGCEGSDYPGQDAEYGRDRLLDFNSDGHAGFSFTKVSSSGVDLSHAAENWSCVRDNVTGLLWEVKRGNGSHDASSRFHWYDPNDATNGGFAGSAGEGENICSDYEADNLSRQCNTNSFVQRVNEERLCGLKNWRMPTAEELHSIVDYGIGDVFNTPAIDTNYFPSGFGEFWTSQTETPGRKAASKYIARAVGTRGGADIDTLFKRSAVRSVRLVSSTVPKIEYAEAKSNVGQICSISQVKTIDVNRYELISNGEEVLDKDTNLIWKRCLEGMAWNGTECIGSPSSFPTQSAYFSHALSQGSGWRVPNIKEIISITEYGCGFPAINLDTFPNTPGLGEDGRGYVQLTSTRANSSNFIWFDVSTGMTAGAPRGDRRLLRLVRDNQINICP